MPKLPALTAQRVIRILRSRGFELDRIKGSHHIYLHPVSRRRVTVPIHRRDLPSGTLYEILRQAGLTREDLLSLL